MRIDGMLLLALLLLPACTTLRILTGVGFVEPEVKIVDIRIQREGTAIHLEVDVKVSNPNHYELEVGKVKYQIFLGESEIGQGSLEQGLLVGEATHEFATLPLDIDAIKALSLIPLLATKPSVVVAAQVSFPTIFGSVERSFRHQKALP